METRSDKTAHQRTVHELEVTQQRGWRVLGGEEVRKLCTLTP